MERTGLCTKCKEWTDVDDSCCGEGAWFEGEIVFGEKNDGKCQIPGCDENTPNRDERLKPSF